MFKRNISRGNTQSINAAQRKEDPDLDWKRFMKPPYAAVRDQVGIIVVTITEERMQP